MLLGDEKKKEKTFPIPYKKKERKRKEKKSWQVTSPTSILTYTHPPHHCLPHQLTNQPTIDVAATNAILVFLLLLLLNGMYVTTALNNYKSSNG